MLVAPTHDALVYDQYWDLERTEEYAKFWRCFDPQYQCDPPTSLGFGREYHYNPGARISFVTDAQRVSILVAYGIGCRESCPGTAPSRCYQPRPGHCFMCGTCQNSCELKLYVDGTLQSLPEQSARKSFEGGADDELLLFDEYNRVERRLEVVMPWVCLVLM